MTTEASSKTMRSISWLPLIIVAMAQILMSFNINALRVSMAGIGASFGTPPTTVGSAIVTHSLFIAGLVMMGARVGALYGPTSVFRAAIAVFGVAMTIMAASPTATVMILAQGIAGAAAAALVPTLVVLITTNYKGGQQATAFGWLGAAEAAASVLAFLIAGFLDTWVGWRYSFGLLVALAIGIFISSKKLEPVERQPDLQIDIIGAALAASAIILITAGFNNINNWGLLLCAPAAPFSLLGLSPAPVMIIGGLVLGQAFIAWSRKRRAERKTPLVALDLARTPRQRSVILLLFVIITLGSAVSFLVPLYIQIVQGRSSLQTGLAIIPYALSIFVAALVVLRLYGFLPSRDIARYAFILVAAGLALLAVVIRNEWETPLVIFGLIVIGVGQGALVTLLFTEMAATSSDESAGDIGALRGTAANLAGAIGTAVAGALLIGLLSTTVVQELTGNPHIPPELKRQVDLDNITFISNDRLLAVLSATTAAPNQIAEALSINTNARLRSLKICLLTLAGLALMAIVPAGNLPNMDGMRRAAAHGAS
jgi:MFS family permease